MTRPTTLPLAIALATLATACSTTLADPVEPLQGEVPAAYATSPQPQAEYADPLDFALPPDADAAIVMTQTDQLPCSVNTAAFFPTNEATLDDYDRERIARFGECLTRYEAKDDIQLQLVGRADARGSDQDNLLLGLQRAQAVKNYLVVLGFDADEITLATAGEERSADDGRTDWDRDRRVDVIAVEKE